MANNRQSVEAEPAYILHQRPYRNSSQLIDCLTLNFGRIGLVAQGSRRPRTGKRSILQPFIPLKLSWVRRGELGRLTDVESAGAGFQLLDSSLMAAYYVNELVMNLTVRDDPNPEIFSQYRKITTELSGAKSGLARKLRLFELRLLQSLGFGLQLTNDDATHNPIDPDAHYAFDPNSGPRVSDDVNTVKGIHLISLRDEVLDDAESLRVAGQLLWQALSGHLGGRRIKTRDVLRDMHERGLLR